MKAKATKSTDPWKEKVIRTVSLRDYQFSCQQVEHLKRENEYLKSLIAAYQKGENYYIWIQVLVFCLFWLLAAIIGYRFGIG
jgi:predicted branched-subunit amino acid permease